MVLIGWLITTQADCEKTKLSCDRQVAGLVIYQYTASCILFSCATQGDLERFSHRFAVGADGVDIHNLVEAIAELQHIKNAPGVIAIRVGEYGFAQGQFK